MAKILLVDDDQVLLKLYSTKLTADQHQVEIAVNGEDGIQKLSSFIPDVIILDLLMPKFNGFSFIETLKKDAKLAQIPIIVFSSVASQDQIERLKALGVSHYLNKVETSPTQLVEAINQVLSPAPSPQPAE